jgi:hypothetical protein
MFQFTTNSKSPSGSNPNANGIPATAPSVMGEEALKAVEFDLLCDVRRYVALLFQRGR